LDSIFLSHRRADAEGPAGRLFQSLADQFGRGVVLLDQPGPDKPRDARKSVDERLAPCRVLLVLIGKGWLQARDDTGLRCLDKPRDPVRLEIATALRRGIPVLPVLLGGATMPHEGELPDDLQDLVMCDGAELTPAQWPTDVQRLIATLARVLGQNHGTAVPVPTAVAAAGRRRWGTWLLGLAVLAGLGGGSGWLLQRQAAERARDAAAAEMRNFLVREREAADAAAAAQQRLAAEASAAADRLARDRALAEAAAARRALAAQAGHTPIGPTQVGITPAGPTPAGTRQAAAQP